MRRKEIMAKRGKNKNIIIWAVFLIVGFFAGVYVEDSFNIFKFKFSKNKGTNME